MYKFNKSSGLTRQAGQASKLLLVLAIVVLVAAIIVYLIMRMATPAPKPLNPNDLTPIPLPIYEQTLGNVRFVFESAIDRGTILRVADIVRSKSTYSNQKDILVTTGGKFIQVVVGAQNVGTENTKQGEWGIENIVDSEGRNFVSVDSYNVNPWLPDPNPCGVLLKPAFDPTPCTKIYEVSKESTGLKIRVLRNPSSSKVDSFLLDLIVK